MKNTILFLSLFVSTLLVAQKSFNGTAIYEVKREARKLNLEKNATIPPDMLKEIEERMKKTNTYQCELNFDSNASNYIKIKEEEKLQGGEGNGMVFKTGGLNNEGMLYKNLKGKKFLQEAEIFDKSFLINDSLPEYNWEITQEFKKIGEYTCYKAIGKRKLNSAEIERNKKLQELDEGKSNILSNKTTTDVTAWYCPEIPVSHGPEKFFGLPGLILEINAPKYNILCSKISLSIKESKEIIIPKKGEKVTQLEYDQTMEKKREEINKDFKNGGGNIIIRGN